MDEEEKKLLDTLDLARGGGAPHTSLMLDEGDRQLVILAMAVLSLRSPGFEDALQRIALRIDVMENGRAAMFQALRALRADIDARKCGRQYPESDSMRGVLVCTKAIGHAGKCED